MVAAVPPIVTAVAVNKLVMPHCRNRRYKNRKYNDNRGKHKKIKKIKQTD